MNLLLRSYINVLVYLLMKIKLNLHITIIIDTYFLIVKINYFSYIK